MFDSLRNNKEEKAAAVHNGNELVQRITHEALANMASIPQVSEEVAENIVAAFNGDDYENYNPAQEIVQQSIDQLYERLKTSNSGLYNLVTEYLRVNGIRGEDDPSRYLLGMVIMALASPHNPKK